MPSLYYLTNRFNLLEILSARVIEPRGAYQKYYQDLLELASGRIPLFSTTIGAPLQEIVNSESEQAFPVVIESNASAPATRAPALSKSGKSGNSLVGTRAIAWAPADAIALGGDAVIHFRSEDELKEHAARHYDNVAADWTMRVSPQLFAGDNTIAQQCIDWLKNVGPAPDDRSDSVRRLDRETGGIAAFAAGSDVAFQSVTQAMIDDPRDTVEGHWLADAWRVAGREPEPSHVDLSLFNAIAVAAQSAELGQSAPLVLRSVRESVMFDAMEPAQRDTLEKSFHYYEAVLSNEREFVSFPSSGGSPVLRAFLLLLLRPDPIRLTKVDLTEINADPLTYALAMYFAGLLTGRKRLETTLRPAPLDVALAQRVVRLQAAEPRAERVAGTPKRTTRKKGKPAVDIVQEARARGLDELIQTTFTYDSAKAQIQTLLDGTVKVRVLGFIEPQYSIDMEAYEQAANRTDNPHAK